ncbi:unnamed protein product [Enterobius vermicularis]|uniref:AhpC-TSA domain-containing protein n=1 Tax=Enterobius vermicularis TaxID=51028 RepID=A0A0N4V5E1_ENTVE|nr:unnamed protein product [Enterobius vermicularis]
MDKFKEKAKEQGIEIPAVMTDIDPETGAPAFVNAKTEDFTDYIDKAKAKEEAKPLKTAVVQPNL